jgi:hypothetical protein
MHAMPIANTEYKAENEQRLLCSLNFNKITRKIFMKASFVTVRNYLVTKMCYYLLGRRQSKVTIRNFDHINSDIVKVGVKCNRIPIKYQLLPLSILAQSHAVTYQVHSIVLSDVNVLLPVSVSLAEKKRLFLTFEYKSVAI